MQTKHVTKQQPKRGTASAPMKRLLYMLSTTQPPLPKSAYKRPTYLRYIEYV